MRLYVEGWKVDMGHKRTNRRGLKSAVVRFGPKADKTERNWIVRLVPKADIRDCLLTKPNRIRRAGVCILLGIGLDLHREREARQRD